MRILIASVCMVVTCSWLISAMFLDIMKMHGPLDHGKPAIRVARWIFHEVKPFFQAATVAQFAALAVPLRPGSFWDFLILVANFYYFHKFKDIDDDDDDRWTRRKRFVLGKIFVVNGKLAVNPA